MAEKFDIAHERELLIKAKNGDLLARQECHKIYKGVLDRIVQVDFKQTTQPKEALRMEAEELLDTYIDEWNPLMNNKPSTFLYSSINNKLKRYANANFGMVRTTEAFSWSIAPYKEALTTLGEKLGRRPTQQEILKHMTVKYPDKDYNLKIMDRLKKENRVSGLASSPIGRSDEGTPITVGDIAFTDDDDEDPMVDYLRDATLREIHSRVNMLQEPQRSIIMYHYGMNGYPELSLRDLALKFGINKYRVDQYIRDADQRIHEGL